MFNIVVTILGLLIFGYGIVLYLLGYIFWPELSRLVVLSYAFFVFGVLGLKNRLNGKVFLESFKIVFFLYAIFCMIFFLNQCVFLDKKIDFEFKGALFSTENFLMLLASFTAIKTKWPHLLKHKR